jgi:Tfp pilus assembly protein PilX
MSDFLAGQRRQQRGSALLMAVIVVLVLGVIGLGIVSRAGRETETVAAKRKADESVSCAEAARELLMSQFSAYGASPVELTLNRKMDSKTLASGHYGSVAVKSVTASTGASQSSFGVSDVSNRLGRVGMGGQVYRMTVVCQSAAPAGGSTPRESEVEYLVRFGL